MRFERIRIEKYGHFAELELTLPSGSGLVLVYGPNERGKTTLLHAIRDLFFGVPHRSPYTFRFPGGSMSIAGRLVTRGGEILDLTRRKGRGKTLSVVCGTPEGETREIDEAAFLQRFASIDRDRYTSVFGITLEDLQKGAEGLRAINLEELLAGGALGGSGQRIHAVRSMLHTEREELYKPRGQLPRINARIKEIAELRRHLKETIFRLDAYRALEGAIGQTKERLETCNARLDALRKRQRHHENLWKGWPIHQELRGIEARLQTPDLQSPIPDDAVGTYADLLREIEAIDTEIGRLNAGIARWEGEGERNRPDPAILAEEETISTLLQRLDGIEKARRQNPKRRQRHAEMEAALSQELAALLPGAGLERLRTFQHDLPVTLREEIRTLAHESEGVGKRIEKIEIQQESSREQFEEAEATLAARAARFDDETIVELYRQIDDVEKKRSRVHELQERIERLREGVNRRKRDLPDPPGFPWEGGDALSRLHLPHDAALREEEAKWRRLEAAVHEGEAAAARIEKERRQNANQLTALIETRRVPSRADLEGVRKRRDTWWRRLREGNEKPARGEPGELFPEDPWEAFETAMKEADDLADRLYEEAELVSRRLQLEEKVATLTAEAAQALADLTAAREALDQWQASWRGIWEPLGVEALSPPLMREWLESVGKIREDLIECTGLERDLGLLAPDVEAAEERFRHLLGSSPDLSWESLVAEVRDRYEAFRSRRGEQRVAQEHLEKAQKTLARLGEKLRREREREKNLHLRAIEIAHALGFEDDPTPERLEARIEQLDELARRLGDLDQEAQALDEETEEVRNFDETLQALLTRLGREVPDPPRAGVIRELSGELRENAERKRLHDQAKGEIDRARREVQAALERRKRARARLDELDRRYGIPDATQRQRALERAQRRAEAQREGERCHRDLSLLFGGGERLCRAREELDRFEPESLQHELDRLAREMEQLREEEAQSREELGKLHERRDRLGGEEGARLQARIEELRAALEEEVTIYVRLSAAEAILDDAVQRYTREHQAEIFRQASDFFASITGGRYVRVLPDPERGQLLVEGVDGQKRPGELSTGTREQLFLAFRLAYVLEHAAKWEPLPVILDDVLVDFDNERTRAVLERLADLGPDQQVIVLTCHRHVLEVAADLKLRSACCELAAEAL